MCGTEELVGDNRLTCDACTGRHDTTRSVRLGRRAEPTAAAGAGSATSPAAPPPVASQSHSSSSADEIIDVPPLLWLPLSRFDYDRERGARVKLTSPFLVRRYSSVCLSGAKKKSIDWQ